MAKIAIGADHAGVDLKDHLAQILRQAGHEVQDFGTHSHDSVDYPDIAAEVARAVVADDLHGILVCGTGIGVAISANKIHGVRAATCGDIYSAAMSREHNDANILCLGARVVGAGVAQAMVEAFVSTPFGGDRHGRRVSKIMALEC